MKIISDSLSLEELKQLAAGLFGDMVKAVVDIERGVIAVDAELHSDLEALLLQNGSKQKDVWGINLYPELQGENFVEFSSMINMRPSQNNMSRGVDDENIRKRIIAVVMKRVNR